MCVSLRVFAQRFRLLLLAVACFLLALCLSCDSLATALGYYGASVLLGASLAPFWHQLAPSGLLGLSYALLGLMLDSPGALLALV